MHGCPHTGIAISPRRARLKSPSDRVSMWSIIGRVQHIAAKCAGHREPKNEDRLIGCNIIQVAKFSLQVFIDGEIRAFRQGTHSSWVRHFLDEKTCPITIPQVDLADSKSIRAPLTRNVREDKAVLHCWQETTARYACAQQEHESEAHPRALYNKEGPSLRGEKVYEYYTITEYS
jgi:hypothetical protein